MTPRGDQVRPNEWGDDPGQVGPDSAGQSGDTQGLGSIEEADEESVEELAETGQGYEADLVSGVEEAADHPERPVRVHRERPGAGEGE